MSQHVSKQRCQKKKPETDVTSIFGEKERYVYSSRGAPLPLPPIVAAPAFNGRALSILEFLLSEESEPFLDLVIGANGTDASVMLHDFRHATRGLYFGYRRAGSKKRPPKNPGRLDESNSKTRGRLTEFARRAYRGDPDRYSAIYWKRIAGLIWDSYRFFNSTRQRAAWISEREEKRIAEIPMRREKPPHASGRIARERSARPVHKTKQVNPHRPPIAQ